MKRVYHSVKGTHMSQKECNQSFLLASDDFEPAYLALYRSGELQQRVQQALQRLEACDICPRNCHVDRTRYSNGYCRTGRHAIVSSAFPHRGEEECLRGSHGSGTIFFSMCNLGCVFCQNFDISQAGLGEVMLPEDLANIMLRLQAMECHNINVVTPSHVVPQIIEALAIAVEQGLRLPIVYNTSAYDGLESLRMLDGIVDIYMPDFKCWDPHHAKRYMYTPDYPDVARVALKEMHRQVGELKMDEHGVAKRGVLVRHLVMPGLVADTQAIMRFLAEELSPDTYINIMAQYHPSGKVAPSAYTEINCRLTSDEYADAIRAALDVGLWRLDERHPFWFMK